MRVARFVRSLVARVGADRIHPEVPPVTITDRDGRELFVRSYRKSDFDALAKMYDAFDTEHRAQGTPPVAPTAVRRWLRDILDGVNVLAVHDDRIVGHVSFVPDGTGRHELAVFVHQEYHGGGSGRGFSRRDSDGPERSASSTSGSRSGQIGPVSSGSTGGPGSVRSTRWA